MLALHPQYIVDETQAQQAVVIQINEWQEVIKQLEMLDDIEAYLFLIIYSIPCLIFDYLAPLPFVKNKQQL
jgi:hypothetical protein